MTYIIFVIYVHVIILYYALTAFQARVYRVTIPTQGQTVQFANETLDIGGGYNPSTSVYTVPQTGIYTFTWTIRIGRYNYYVTELVVNTAVKDRMMTSTWGSNNTHTYDATSSATTTAQLTTGDRVFIRVQLRSGLPNIYSDADGYSTFSGWLLH